MSEMTNALVSFARTALHEQTSDQFHDGATRLLMRTIGADQVFWAETDFAQQTSVVLGDVSPSLGDHLGTLGPSHPAIQSYVGDPADLRPRRVSDVTDRRSWHRCALYREAFAEFGEAHQMSLVTAVEPPAVGRGWTLTRSGRDFRDAELDQSSRLLPVLLAIDEALRARTAAAGAITLSEREAQVLLLLSQGFTAASIGWRCGITERTVRKHLGSIYLKLECTDRLVAVRRAAELGLLSRRVN